MTSSAKIPHVARLVQQTLRHMKVLESLADDALSADANIHVDGAHNPLADKANRAGGDWRVNIQQQRAALQAIAKRPVAAEMVLHSETTGADFLLVFMAARHAEVKEWQTRLGGDIFAGVMLLAIGSPAKQILDQDVGWELDEDELKRWAKSSLTPGLEALKDQVVKEKIVYLSRKQSWQFYDEQQTWDGIEAEAYVSRDGSRVPVQRLSEFMLEFVPRPVGAQVGTAAGTVAITALTDAEVASSAVLRRTVIKRLGLRERNVVDPEQSRIIYQHLTDSIFVTGSAGTGKTTTLASRIRSKVMAEYRTEEDREFILHNEEVRELVGKERWICFTPDQVLSQQIQNASAQGDLTKNYRSLDNYRTTLGTNVFGFMKPARVVAAAEDEEPVNEEDDLTLDCAIWRKPRRGQKANDVLQERLRSTEGLVRYFNLALDGIRELEVRNYNNCRTRIQKCKDPLVARYVQSFFDQLGQYRKVVSGDWENLMLIPQAEGDLRAAIRSQKEHVSARLTEIVGLVRKAGLVQASDKDATLKNALRRYAAGKADAKVRKAQAEGKFDAAFAGLTAKKLATAAQLKQLGHEVLAQKSMKRLDETLVRLISGAWPLYQAWRVGKPGLNKFEPNEIDSNEYDILILLGFKIADDLMRVYRNAKIALPDSLSKIRDARQYQVFVDEAPDFTIIQLAAMACLTPPSARALFCVGDFSQRQNSNGIGSLEDLKHLGPPPAGEDPALYLSVLSRPMATAQLTRSYRQSEVMYDFARALRTGGGAEQDRNLTVHQPDESVVPQIGQARDEVEISSWIVDRLLEIQDLLPEGLPSVAVFVAGDDNGRRLADALEDARYQAGLNVEAVFCDGANAGEGHQIRVFDLAHVKGLEFEAAFVVNLDEMERRADWSATFQELLYVAATRAATFFGVTYSESEPTCLAPVRHLMATDGWGPRPEAA